MDKKALKEAQEFLGKALSMIEGVRDDEQSSYDDKSDKWKEGEAAGRVEENINTLEEAIDQITAANDNIDSVLSN